MRPIQPLPLFMNNHYLTGVRSPGQSPPMTTRSSQSDSASPVDNSFDLPFMGGSFSEILSFLLQWFKANSVSNRSYSNPGSTPNPPASPAGTPAPQGSSGSIPLSLQGPPSGGNPPLGPAAQAEEDEGCPAEAAGSEGANVVGNNTGPAEAPPTADEAPPGQPAPGESGQGAPPANQPVIPRAQGAQGPAAASGGSSKPSPSGEPDLDRWDPQIEAAARSTGLPAHFIKATMWAESRGKPEVKTVNGGNGHIDQGLMQISDHTYGLVMKSQPNAPRGLRADNPNDNIMMGAWELKDKAEKAGGDLFETSKAYVGTGDAHEEEYATWVQTYMRELDEGKKLSDF